MKLTAAQDFTSLTDLLRLYSDADEIVFKSHCHFDESEIAEACRHARRLARHWGQQGRLHHSARTAEEVAASLGCRVLHEAFQMAEGKVIYLAECSFPPQTGEAIIRVNTDAVTSLAGLMAQWASEIEQPWFTEAKISEVAIAHELFHLIEQRPSSALAELEAHAFARAFTSLPFSPLLYNKLLARLSTK